MQTTRLPVLVRIHPTLTRLADMLALGLLTGFISGALAGGIGSRLAMRLAGIMAQGSSRFSLTEAGARPGKITFDGTLFLVFFGAFIGVLGGMFYVAITAFADTEQGPLSVARTRVPVIIILGVVAVAGLMYDIQAFSQLISEAR